MQEWTSRTVLVTAHPPVCLHNDVVKPPLSAQANHVQNKMSRTALLVYCHYVGRHNLTTKPLIQNSPIIVFQDNIVLSLHCTFQLLIFSEICKQLSCKMTPALTHSLTNTHTDYHMHTSGTKTYDVTTSSLCRNTSRVVLQSSQFTHN